MALERHKAVRDPIPQQEGDEAQDSFSSGVAEESTSGPHFSPELLKIYSIEARIGDGGQGVVHRVRRLRDGRLFACKTVRISEPDIDRDLALVQQEARALERLRSAALPGVVGLEEVIVDRGLWHIVLELCACSLHDRIHQIPSAAGLPEGEAALVIKSLAQIVGKFHEMGIVHRDLKPPNVLLTSKTTPYEVRVADFGLSAKVSRKLKKKKKLKGSVGTPKYLAPEVVRGGRYDKAVDIWGLGLILYEMVSGKLAFQGLDSDFVMKRLGWVDYPAGMLDLEGIGEEARDLILGMLSLDPEMRLSCEEIQEHPWVVRNTSGEEFAPKTPQRYVVKMKRVNGVWLSEKQQRELEEKTRAQQQMEIEAQVKIQGKAEENWEFAPRTPIPVLRLKKSNGVWVPERRERPQQQDEEIKKLVLGGKIQQQQQQEQEEVENDDFVREFSLVLEREIEQQQLQEEMIQKQALELEIQQLKCQQQRQQQREENQKRDLKRRIENNNVELRSHKRLRLKCVNGFWQVAKPCAPAVAV